VLYEVQDRVAVLTLNRPEKRNAVDPLMAAQLEAAIDRYEADQEVLVAVLQARMAPGHAVFCAGHDLSHFRSTLGTPAEDAVTTPTGGFAGITRKARRKPLIAAVDGLATSGGCEIVLACDLVVASRRAGFALAEVRWNLVASAGGGFRLPRAVGRAVAMDMLLTAEPISGERAYQLGLASRLALEGEATATALEVAATITVNGPTAVAISRRLVEHSPGLSEPEAWEALDAAAAKVRASQDFLEGLAAFGEGRTARWSGR
jgi:enoyl-CoA hydratase/carnithine racemase